ncbi:MAG: formate dehydrogenase accessory sulfurtransferase FdhD [Acetobacter sp.]
MESDQALLPISTTSQVVRATWHAPSDTSPTLSEETLRLAEEVPLALVYNGLEYAVMMVTPCDIADFVTGFSITEGIVQSGSDIRQVSVSSVGGGLQADIRVSADALRTVLGRSRRPIAGRTGCGICGSDMQSVLKRASNTVQPYQPEFSAIRFALTNLRRHQVLNAGIGMLHAAAWCGTDGKITSLREDVGRHNALDKLIGHSVKNGVDFADGFGLLTSRCSYEMATKAIVAGMRALVSLSAPTALALRTAQQAGLTLISPAKPENICVLPTSFEQP